MRELQYALRQLRRRLGFSAAIIVLFAVGLGATTAIFSLFYQLLRQPLPVPEPDRLVNLVSPGEKWGSTSCGTAGSCDYVFSYPMFRDLETRQTAFTGIAAHRDFGASLSYRGEAVVRSGMLVSGEYFSVLNLQPSAGRLIGPQDEPRIGESWVVVLSYDYWQDQFGGDPRIIGEILTVNGHELVVIGVAPEGFSGTTTGVRPSVFVPLTLRWQLQPAAPRDYENRMAYWLYLFARLRPGVSMEEAAAATSTLYNGIVNEIEAPLHSFLPEDAQERLRERRLTVEPGDRGQSVLPAAVDGPLTLLFALTVVVLLIVCVNIANLLLIRGVSKAGETAVRASMGATGRHLVLQASADVGVLAVLGAVLSLPVAVIVLRLIVARLPQWHTGLITPSLEPAVMLFTAVAAATTALLFGLIPTYRAMRVDPAMAVKGQAARTSVGRGAVRFRNALTIAQVAFSCCLLIVAGYFTQSLANVGRVDLGMSVDELITFTVSASLSGRSREETPQFFDRIDDILDAEPAVAGFTAAAMPLLAGASRVGNVTVEGFEAGPLSDTTAFSNEVNPHFFTTLSIPLLAGRDFTQSDAADSSPVAIVNESFLRKFNLSRTDAVGKRFGIGETSELAIEIVGVVADAKYTGVKDAVPAQYFTPRRQNPGVGMLAYYLRPRSGGDSLLREIPRIVSQVGPGVPILNLKTMRRHIEEMDFVHHLVGFLSASFGVLSTVLAAVGLYGILSYDVAERTSELGVRIALGATPGRVTTMVLKRAAMVALIGLPVGAFAGIALTRAAEGLLFGLSGFEPAIVGGAMLVVIAVAILAALIPARRASRLGPSIALRAAG